MRDLGGVRQADRATNVASRGGELDVMVVDEREVADSPIPAELHALSIRPRSARVRVFGRSVGLIPDGRNCPRYDHAVSLRTSPGRCCSGLP